jgi:NAD(P)-dependent dehydrogenase (short-subunit alcohol dehydrogenase family)
VLEIVKRSDDVRGFKVLPHRWVVERTLAWLGRYRRLSKDYEQLPQTSESMIYAAMIRLMLRRLASKEATVIVHKILYRHALRETKRSGKLLTLVRCMRNCRFPHFTSYCASKGGVRMMMRNLAIELGPLGITINNVAPGAIETPINKSLLNDPEKLSAVLKNIPLGRLGQPC